MIPHLSPQQMSEWFVGEPTAEMQQHARECAACRAELAKLGTALSGFRESAHNWADQQYVSENRSLSRTPLAPYLPALNAFSWAVVAIIICIIGVFSTRHRSAPPTAVETADSDAVLLQRIDAEVSQAVPSSLEPLTSLVSWQAPESVARTVQATTVQ